MSAISINGMRAIFKKEMRSYFYSPLAYVLIGVFLWIMGVIFSAFVSIYQEYNALHRYGQSSGITVDRLVSQLFQNMAFILCFISPMLTMKLFAEEKRQQTFELLFTAPINGFQLVLGKFFSALTLMGVMVAFSFFYIAFLLAWGNPDATVIATTYLGLMLALCCYLSLGGLISALSNSQAIAAVWTFIALLLLWLLQTLGQRVAAKWGPIEWGPTLTYISPLGHFNPFVEGVIHFKDITYFVTFTGLMLFLTHRVVESNRWR
jgi:ABC-2 type transport system permease protein